MGKMNMQNMIWKFSKDLKSLNIDHRGIHRARPGHLFVISDLSQIEPRCLNWLANNKEFLEACRVTSPYQANSIAMGTWTMEQGDMKKKDPKMYALAKAQVLSLGYGASYNKFLEMVSGYGENVNDVIGNEVDAHTLNAFKTYLNRMDEMTESKMWSGQLKKLTTEEIALKANSWKIVTEWRAGNPLITGLWSMWNDKFAAACRAREAVYSVTLPVGRDIDFWRPRFKVQKDEGSKRSRDVMTCYRRCPVPGRNSNRFLSYMYGGKVVQNLNQGLARDVIGECMIHIVEETGCYVLWTIHDEVVVEVEKERADAVLRVVTDIMSTEPSWAPGLPIACEAKITDRYEK